jgi:hypothetical protein
MAVPESGRFVQLTFVWRRLAALLLCKAHVPACPSWPLADQQAFGRE